jgi:hypothetical protein
MWQDSSGSGVCLFIVWGCRNGERAVPKALTLRLTFAAAACFDAPAAVASGGNAPWCAVIDYGDGGVSWECVYRSFDECYPNVIAGNKGSCNVNPYGPGPQAATLAMHGKNRKHYVQH